MEQRPVVMSKSLMISATERAQRRIKEWEEFSTAVLTDGRKEERLTRLECKVMDIAVRWPANKIATPDGRWAFT